MTLFTFGVFTGLLIAVLIYIIETTLNRPPDQ